MAFRPIGPFNGYVAEPSRYAIGFVRDPKKFKLNLYAQYCQADAPLTRFWKLDPDAGSRVVNLEENAWGYGDYRPTHKGNVLRGEWVPVSIDRFDFGYTLDYESIKSWQRGKQDPKALYNAVVLQEAMTHRTARAILALKEANWGSNTATAEALNEGAGTWDEASGDEADPAFQAITRSLNAVKIQIELKTGAAIEDDDAWCLVISPKVALAIRHSGEMFEALKQQQAALSQLITQQTGWRNQKWGLPDRYAGFEIVVENTVRTRVRMKADGTLVAELGSEKDYVLNGDEVFVTTRPGGVNAMPGSPSFATLQLHWYESESQISLFDKPEHELVEGHVTLKDTPIVASPETGFKITGVLSA